MDINLIEVLSKCNLFKDMTEKEIAEFLSYSYRVEEYTKDDIFALAGDQVNSLMIILRGALITRMVSESGRYLQIEKISEGKLVASAMLFATKSVFPVNVMPERDVSVFFMRKETLSEAMLGNTKLLFNFIRIVSDINHFLSSKIQLLSLRTIRGKIAEFILSESKQQDGIDQIKITLTRQELADKFGISRQSLIRSLTELEEEGFIAVHGRGITIIDRARLLLEE